MLCVTGDVCLTRETVTVEEYVHEQCAYRERGFVKRLNELTVLLDTERNGHWEGMIRCQGEMEMIKRVGRDQRREREVEREGWEKERRDWENEREQLEKERKRWENEREEWRTEKEGYLVKLSELEVMIQRIEEEDAQTKKGFQEEKMRWEQEMQKLQAGGNEMMKLKEEIENCLQIQKEAQKWRKVVDDGFRAGEERMEQMSTEIWSFVAKNDDLRKELESKIELLENLNTQLEIKEQDMKNLVLIKSKLDFANQTCHELLQKSLSNSTDLDSKNKLIQNQYSELLRQEEKIRKSASTCEDQVKNLTDSWNSCKSQCSELAQTFNQSVAKLESKHKEQILVLQSDYDSRSSQTKLEITNLQTKIKQIDQELLEKEVQIAKLEDSLSKLDQEHRAQQESHKKDLEHCHQRVEFIVEASNRQTSNYENKMEESKTIISELREKLEHYNTTSSECTQQTSSTIKHTTNNIDHHLEINRTIPVTETTEVRSSLHHVTIQQETESVKENKLRLMRETSETVRVEFGKPSKADRHPREQSRH